MRPRRKARGGPVPPGREPIRLVLPPGGNHLRRAVPLSHLRIALLLLTRWTLFDATFIGLDNFAQFFREPFLVQGLINTLIYGGVTSGMKVVLGLLLAVLLTSEIIGRGYLRSVVFFPVLVSTIGVGITFTALMHPTTGVINETLELFGIKGPGWLTDPKLRAALGGAGRCLEGRRPRHRHLHGRPRLDPAGLFRGRDHRRRQRPRRISGTSRLPLLRPATVTVIILSLIGGLRSFDLIWAMTRGGPGFTSDVIASVIYKQYQAGFYGLSTAGNVVLFVVVAIIIVPLSLWLNRKEVER